MLYEEEVEQALLSILLRDNQAIEQLPESFKPDHFYNPLHQRIFKAIVTMIHKGKLANPITLAQYFKQADNREEASYLKELAAIILPLRNAQSYAGQIYDFYIRRCLVDMGQTLVQDVQQITLEGLSSGEHVEQLEHKLFNLNHLGTEGRGAQAFSQSLQEAISLAEKAYGRESRVVGVSTGFYDMDRLLGGLHPSDLLILAGRPSMGKTALATNIAFNASLAYLISNGKEGAPVGFFSLEMSCNQLAMRILGQETGISSDRIRRGALEKESFTQFVEVARQLNELPLFIDDTPALSIAHLLTRTRRLKRKENIGLVVVDYLQLLSGHKGGGENRVQELSEITRGLKALAKELSIPVLALSQLSRAVEQRDDKRPQLSDLRESGTIEQDADVVMFVYREEYYESRKKPPEGSDKMAAWQKTMSEIYNVAEVIVAKQRHGPIATIPLHFDGQKTKFSNLAKRDG